MSREAARFRRLPETVMGAGVALTVRFLPDSPTGRTTGDPLVCFGIIPILTLDPFNHRDPVLFVWDLVLGTCVQNTGP